MSRSVRDPDYRQQTAGPLSPDCRDGNHHKCDGTAWDEATDDITGCTCKVCDN